MMKKSQGSTRRTAVSRVAVLLLSVFLAACGSTLPLPPVPTSTPAPSPSPTAPTFPREVLNTSWELDYVLVNGERQPPFHEGQCLAISSRPESYYFYDGCNHGYCDTEEQRSPNSKGDKSILCSLTLQRCLKVSATPSTPKEATRWDTTLQNGLMGFSRAELRAGALWVYARSEGNPTLVFKQMAGPCEAQQGYLKP